MSNEANANNSAAPTASQLAQAVGVRGEDLIKSLAALEAMTKVGAAGKKQELLAKSLSGQASAAEEQELAILLAGSESELVKSVKATLATPGEDLAKSETLKKSHDAVAGAVALLSESLVKSDTAREQSMQVQAKALLDIGQLVKATSDLVKSLNEQLDAWSQQPARSPKAMSNATALAQAQPRELGAQGASLGAGAPTGESAPRGISSQVVMKAMMDLAQKGGVDSLSKSGQSWPEVMAQYQVTKEVHPAVLQEVITHLRGSAA